MYQFFQPERGVGERALSVDEEESAHLTSDKADDLGSFGVGTILAELYSPVAALAGQSYNRFLFARILVLW